MYAVSVVFPLFCLWGGLEQPRIMVGDDESEAVAGILGRGSRSTGRKPAPVPLCPPQIPHDLTRSRTRAAAVRSRGLITVTQPVNRRLLTTEDRPSPVRLGKAKLSLYLTN
jgi:hypothetical protein